MTEDRKPVAEQITDLLTELHDRVDTRETVLRYRTVRRGAGRTAAIPDFVVHRTRRPGLIAQARAAAVPEGSSGWDADGALSPMPSGGSFESSEPVTEAFHLAEETEAALIELAEEVRAKVGHPWLVEAALADEDLGRRIVTRLRQLVSRARIALKYDARIVPLKDVHCPECGGELKVRADASSAVWCSGMVPAEGTDVVDGIPTEWVRCGATWPRWAWVELLAEATADGKMVS